MATNNILKHNKEMIIENIKANYKTAPRAKKGIYVYGDEKKILEHIKKLYEIATLDCNQNMHFNYATLCNNKGVSVGISYGI